MNTETSNTAAPASPLLSTQWLTANEAAQYLRVEPRTVLAWVRQGKLKGYALSGCQRKTWRFLQSDLDAMLTGPSAAAEKARGI